MNTLEGVEETLRRFATSCDMESGEAFSILKQANLLSDALETIRQW